VLNSWLDITNVIKNMQQKVHILLHSWLDITNVSKDHVTKCPHFASEKGGHDSTGHLEED
jgi:hypothetical protein